MYCSNVILKHAICIIFVDVAIDCGNLNLGMPYASFLKCVLYRLSTYICHSGHCKYIIFTVRRGRPKLGDYLIDICWKKVKCELIFI